MTEIKLVSVIVPVFNRASLLPGLISALRCQTVPVEIVIVDDGSTDDPGADLPEVGLKFITQKNSGPAAARNRGAREASGEILAFTDSDCTPAPDWVEKLVKSLNEPGTGAAAGSYDIANPCSLLARLIHSEIRWRHARFGEYVRALGSYNFAVRKETFESLGGFDETYRAASGEDNDFSYRLLKKGLRIRFVPDALVAHLHPEVFLRYLKEQRKHGFWRMKLYSEHPDMMQGDDYTLAKDAWEICLALAIFGLVPGVFRSLPRKLLVLLAVAQCLLQVPKTLSVMRLTGKGESALLGFVEFFRAFSRALGAVEGLLTFGFPRPQKQESTIT